MKLSNIMKVASLLKESAGLTSIETTVASATDKIGSLAIGADLKAKFSAAISGVLDGERARIKADLEALGIEVDTETKTLAEEAEGVLHGAEQGLASMLGWRAKTRVHAPATPSVQTAASP